MHGYDVVDPEKVNEELGGEEGHKRFCARLSELGLGQVLDIVPNHMALGRWNRYWRDVLENGPSSRYASWFDIDWNSPEVKLKNKVLIPVLADQYGKALAPAISGSSRMARHFASAISIIRFRLRRARWRRFWRWRRSVCAKTR